MMNAAQQETVTPVYNVNLIDEFPLGTSLDQVEAHSDWVAETDLLGPGVDLGEFEKLLDVAPEISKDTKHYTYLVGIYEGRLLQQNFGD